MSVNRLIEKFIPSRYDLDLDISDFKNRNFTGFVKITGQIKNDKEFCLHAKGLNIENIKIDGIKTEYRESENDEKIIKLPTGVDTSSQSIIEIKFSGKITDSMHGLYPCYYKIDGENKEMFATQFESHYAREVFPCVDEPEAKAVFSLKVSISEDMKEIISNTKVKSQIDKGDKKVFEFYDTPVMSTYLLAFVGGDLQKKTAKSKNGVEVSVYSTKAQNESLLDFPLDIATRVLDFYEEYFDEKFPLEKCDHIALPDFSNGAMENWGIITYRESALLADDKSSIYSKKYISLVIAHETAHQWFGNLVTMKWWDDLWLNESFATMMEYFTIDNIMPSWGIWQLFAASESIIALGRDATDGVQPVRLPVNHPDEIDIIFDGAIVYAKGARLLNMLRAYIGEDDFKRGLRAYFKEFAYKNTTGEDLWKSLEDASGKPISKFMNYWLDNPGYPYVRVDIKDGKLKLEQSQFFIGEGKDQGRVWPIFLNSDCEDIPSIFDQKSAEFDIGVDHIRLNKDNVSHFLPYYSESIFADILKNINSLDGVGRLQILQERLLLSKSEKIPSYSLIETIKHYSTETNPNVWRSVNVIINDILLFIEPESEYERKFKKIISKLVDYNYKRLIFDRIPTYTDSDIQMKPIIVTHAIYSGNEHAIQDALESYEKNKDNLINLDAELRSVIISTKIEHDEYPDAVDLLFKEYAESSDVDYKNDICVALTRTKNKETCAKILDTMRELSIIRPQDLSGWYIRLLWNNYVGNQAWKWLLKNWAWIESIFSGDKSYDGFVSSSGSVLKTEDGLKEFSEFFDKYKDDPALKRVIEMGKNQISAKIKLIEKEKPKLEQYLDSQE